MTLLASRLFCPFVVFFFPSSLSSLLFFFVLFSFSCSSPLHLRPPNLSAPSLSFLKTWGENHVVWRLNVPHHVPHFFFSFFFLVSPPLSSGSLLLLTRFSFFFFSFLPSPSLFLSLFFLSFFFFCFLLSF